MVRNEKIQDYIFLEEMYEDPYFPDFLVDKGKEILLNLCFLIENQTPGNLDELFELTHAATNEFNKLNNEFIENESEIETVARDCIGMDFEYIVKIYGYNVDTEELISNREW